MPKAVYLILLINLIISIDVNSQNMQAGNINPESTEEVFKSLMDKCDDMDIIMLRGRIRVEIQRSTPEAIEEANKLMIDGLTACSKGENFKAKTLMEKGYKVINAGVKDRFSIKSKENKKSAILNNKENNNEKPWWKFW